MTIKKVWKRFTNIKGQMFIMAVILMAVATISILNSVIEIKNTLETPKYNAFGDLRSNVLTEVQNGMEFILAKYTSNASYGENDALKELQQLLNDLEQYTFQKGFSLSLQVDLTTFLIETTGKSELTNPNNITNLNQNHYSVIAFQLRITSSGTAREGFFYDELKTYYYSANLTLIPTNNTIRITQQRWDPTRKATSNLPTIPASRAIITYANATISQVATEITPLGTYTFPSSINLASGNIIVILPNGVRIIT